jgi:hypothetical protein
MHAQSFRLRCLGANALEIFEVLLAAMLRSGVDQYALGHDVLQLRL